MRARSRVAAAAGSGWPRMAETTAMPSAPAAQTSAALSAVMPPMPISFSPVRRRSSATPAKPSGGARSALVGVANTGLAAT